MRIAILWSHLSGYLNACMKALAGSGHEVFVSSFYEDATAPFSISQFAWIGEANHSRWLSGDIDRAELESRLKTYRPDLLLISGWNHAGYRHVARVFKEVCPRVLCMDNPWEETARQWLGRLIAPWYVQPLFDAAFVGGERQFQFARRLGFSEDRIFQGVFSCDTVGFSQSISFDERHGGFVYIGRLSPEKGISELLAAYRLYREQQPNGWPLAIAGIGPLRQIVEVEDCVNYLGFLQPDDLPALLRESRTLVAPSLWDHWGIQIHEGTTAGLPVICTSVCGSAVHLVRDGFNGYWVAPGDVSGLATAMNQLTMQQDLDVWSERSRILAAQFTPEIWVQRVEAIYVRLTHR